MKQTNEQIRFFHQQYIASRKKEKRLIRFFQLIIFVSFFLLWEAASRHHWIDPLLFSSPSAIWGLFVQNLADNSLVTHAFVTLLETMLGFMIGTVAGACFGALLW